MDAQYQNNYAQHAASASASYPQYAPTGNYDAVAAAQQQYSTAVAGYGYTQQQQQQIQLPPPPDAQATPRVMPPPAWASGQTGVTQSQQMVVHQPQQSGVSYTGMIKSYNPEKGWGFIDCPETFGSHGKDVMVLKTELNGAEKGDTVSFGVVLGPKGMKACDIVVVSKGAGSGGYHSGYGTAQMGQGGYGQKGAGNFQGSGTVTSGGSHMGVVKRYNPQTGWGFIECQETFQLYGKDILVLRTDLEPCGANAQGDTVSFSVGEDQRGKKAVNISLVRKGDPMSNAGPGGPAAPGTQIYVPPAPGTVPSKGYGNPRPQTQRSPMMNMGGASPNVHSALRGVNLSGVDPAAVNMLSQLLHTPQVAAALNGGKGGSPQGRSDPGPFVGCIKNFDEGKGYGFIVCDATKTLFGKDIFFLGGVLGDQAHKIGDTVVFKPEMTAKGPQANEVKVLPEGSLTCIDGPPGMVFSGHVSKAFFAEKGFGFIHSDHAQIVFGISSGIFLHKNLCGGHIPQQGEPVEFSVGLEKEKLQAINVAFPGGISGGMLQGAPGGMPGGGMDPNMVAYEPVRTDASAQYRAAPY